jgi:7-cyano-7-deazaguanine synthase in queuosine biosynthesis
MSMTRSKAETFVYEIAKEKIFQVAVVPENVRGTNCFIVGSALFELEKILRERRILEAVLPLFGVHAFGYELGELRLTMAELLVLVLVEDISIDFTEYPYQTSLVEDFKSGHVPSICLFSGGTDSYSGLLLAKEQLREVEGVFCAHADQSKIIRQVEELERTSLKKFGVKLHKIAVPSIGSQGYAQLRGFLYCLASGIWINLLGASRLIITECGPTMYQPRFGPFDSVTMTTNPGVLALAGRALQLLLKRPVDIITPFEDLTKAEVIAISPAKRGLRSTHSCISQRFGTHDGTCYGCVIRRLGALAAGVRDVDYLRDPLTDENARSGNLMSLLLFCYDVLTNFEGMEDYEVENINLYGKRDLFRRFALDNFAAIHRLNKKKAMLVPTVRKMYRDVVSTIGKTVLEERINALEERNFPVRFAAAPNA